MSCYDRCSELPRDEVGLHFNRRFWASLSISAVVAFNQTVFSFVFPDFYFYFRTHDYVLVVMADFMY